MKLTYAHNQFSGWPSARLADVCQRLTSGGTPSRRNSAYYTGSGGVPWVKTQEIADSVIYETSEHITETALSESSAKLLPAGTLLMAMYAAPTAGRLAILGREMSCNQAACAITCDESLLDTRFLFYQLLASRADIHTLANGAAQQNLSVRMIKDLEIALPPLDEQRRIAGVLGALDDLAAVELDQAERTAQLAQALVARAEVRIRLGDVATEHRVTCTSQGLTDHFSLPAFDAGVLPERMQGSDIKSSKNQLRAPCVLISRLNPHIPRVWMAYPDEAVNSVASTEFVVVEPNGAEVEWLWGATSGQEFVAQMQGHVTGTTGSHQRVDKAALMQLTIPSPAGVPESDRNAVVDLVRESAAARKEAAQLQRTRDELLPLLLSGRVRVGEVAA